MTRKAKRSSTANHDGSDLGAVLGRRPFATRGASLDVDRSGAPAGRCLLPLVLAACILALSAAPAGAATKVIQGEFCKVLGEGAGQCRQGLAVAVNRSGAGGVPANEVYLADSVLNRVDEFSPFGEFVSAFGYDVVGSGPDNTGVTEQQKLIVKASGGRFALIFNEKSTAATGSGTISNGSNVITGVTTTNNTFAVGQVLTVNGSGIPSTPTQTTITGCASSCSAPTSLTISANATASGSKSLTGHNLPYNASATEVEAALNGLSTVGAVGGSVSVARVEKSPTEFEYTIAFGGNLSGDDVPQIEATTNGLEGTKVATIVTANPGGGVERCRPLVNPADVCKAGSANIAAAGAASGPQNIAIDQATGNLYLADNPNKRVDVFSAKGFFEASFGLDTIPSGAAGEGTVTSGSTEVTAVTTTSKAFLVGQAITGTGIPAGTTITAVEANKLKLSNAATPAATGLPGTALTAPTGAGNVAVNEQQTVILPAATTAGTFTLTFVAPNPQSVTASQTATAIPYNATPAEVEAKLVALTNIGAGNVAVTSSNPGGVAGVPGGPYTVEFKGARYADTNVAQMTASGTGLTPSGTVTIATPREGTGFETCTTATTCQAGSNSQGAGAFSELSPAGLAVNPGNGHLWVGDAGNASAGNHRIDEFSFTLNGSNEVTAASFVRALGWKVKVAGAAEELQECTTASGCQRGTLGKENGQFTAGAPTSLAVDSSGYVYVGSAGSEACSIAAPCRVQKFNPDGTFKEAFGPSSGGAAECQLTWTNGLFRNAQAPLDLAVDPVTQHLFLTRMASTSSFEVCEFDGTGALKDRSPLSPLSGSAAGSSFPRLALSSTEHIYTTTSASSLPLVTILGPAPPPPPVEALPAENITATSAKLNGKVTVPSPGGPGFNTTYHFEYSADNGFHWASIPVPDLSVGTVAGTVSVNQVLTGLQPSVNYLFRLVGTTGSSNTSAPEHFTTAPAKPAVAHTMALPVAGTTATLTGAVNPNNSSTVYRFEWGETTAYGNQAPDFEPFVGSAGQPITVKTSLSGLSLSTLYHFRLVATNESGTTFGPDTTFETTATEGLDSAGLPDNRAYELVSPADKRPQGLVETATGTTELSFQAADDGQSIFFPIRGGLADATAGGQVNYVAKRGPLGWSSLQASPPTLVPNASGRHIQPSFVEYASGDLSCELVATADPLTADTPKADVELGVENLYRRNEDGSFTLLSDAVPSNAQEVAESAQTALGLRNIAATGASANCGRVFFQSPYQWLPGHSSGLYEWDEGILRDAGALPNGSPGAEAGPGAAITPNGKYNNGSLNTFNAVSAEGRLFFGAKSNQGGDSGKYAVFARKGPGSVIDVSQKQPGGTSENLNARYETASPNGSHVFFAANYGLVTPSSSGPFSNECKPVALSNTDNGLAALSCDLYDYDLSSGALTDLSAVSGPANPNGASVDGVVAVSDDGSYVYFAARGQLVPGKGSTYAQNVAGSGSANVYLAHNGTLAYVATITVPDYAYGNTNPHGAASGDLVRAVQAWSAQSTPDGQTLLFTTKAGVTGYESGGPREAYLYSARADKVVCVSCRPDGLPAVLGEQGLVANPLRSIWTQYEGYYRKPRSLSDDGSRVFFTMADVLAPGAIAGNYNLYEWEKGKIYLLFTSSGSDGKLGFVDSGASGDDVFIITEEQLDGNDTDFVQDIYDLRVGGGFPNPAPPPIPCDPAADQCQGTPTAAPSPSSPVSQSLSGAGNPPLQPPPCPKGKVRRHGKCVPKNSRHKKHPKRHNRAANIDHGGAK